MGSLHAAAPADPTRISNSPLDRVWKLVKSIDKDWSIWCVDCRRWNHRRCLQMTVEDIKVLAKYRWHCGCKQAVAEARRSQPTAPPSILQTQRPSPATRTKEGLRVAQLNIEGCRSKSMSLNKFLEEEKVDIAVLIETKLLEKTPTPDANSRTVHRLERKIHLSETEQPQGGVAIMCRPGLVSNRLDPLHLPERGTGSLGCGGRNRTRQTTGVVYLPSPS